MNVAGGERGAGTGGLTESGLCRPRAMDAVTIRASAPNVDRNDPTNA